MVGLKIDFCFLLRWYVTAWIDLSLVGSYSPVGFKYGFFCKHVLCARGLQLDVEANRLVGASSGYRYAFKAMLSTSFFCGYGPACIF